ncbi:MAG: ankyrin repeat domain-containing protein, partial [Nostocaceae cyanobacterium]|nr:ankyrin repeat domain-containing protein [Nostocaceae cyanobacterium]
MMKNKFVASVVVQAIAAVGVTIFAVARIPNPYKSAVAGILGFPTDQRICQNADAMKNYLNTGGNPNAVINFGNAGQVKMTLMACANYEVAQLLLADNNLDVNTALFNVLSKPNNKNIVEKLLLRGANVNRKSTEGKTPLHLVRTPEIAELLLNKGANINALDDNFRTPLHAAAADATTRNVVKLLLAAGANVNAKDKDGRTPLHLAVAVTQNRETIRLLLAKRANIDIKDKEGDTPLDLAEIMKDDAIAQLLSSQANLYVQRRDGFTPLTVAAQFSYADIVTTMLPPDADINATDIYGRTLLHWAAKSANESVIKFLLDRGAKVN